MNVSTRSDSIVNSPNFSPPSAGERRATAEAEISADKLIFDLGLWLSGLESFLRLRHQSFGSAAQAGDHARDWSKEFYLTNSTLLLCSKLALQIGKILKDKENSDADETEDDFLSNLTGDNLTGAAARIGEFSSAEVFSLSIALKDSILLNEALLRATPLKFAEWTAWTAILSERLGQFEVARKLIDFAEREGENFLPDVLKNLLQNTPPTLAAEADLRVVLPLFGKILCWLDVIGKMHEADEPLKPALLLFARIYEQTQAMMTYINNRLRRFDDEEDPLFVMLDCTVYAASIEVRKVYNFELVGLSEIRQAPLVYAKVETAYELLNDCFQQIVVNFAQLVDAQIEPTKLFPNFQTKLEQSLRLRRDLWSIQQIVQKTEKNQKEYPLENVYQQLKDFRKGTMRALFYKDLEAVERFIEEVLRTPGASEVVPILHRFGAYLETLLGQVNMRAVLANHPFDYPKE